MANTSRLTLVERLVGGDLVATLTAWRADGLSLDDMAVRMAADHDIDVTRETLRRWCHELGVSLDPVGSDTPGTAA